MTDGVFASVGVCLALAQLASSAVVVQGDAREFWRLLLAVYTLQTIGALLVLAAEVRC